MNPTLQTVRKNQRAARRYGVKTPLEYRIAGCAAWKPGRTVDMSASGVLIDIAEPLVAGCTLEIAMDWPGIYHGKPVVGLYLTCDVVRADHRGTALRILLHEFRDVYPALVRPRPLQRDLAVA